VADLLGIGTSALLSLQRAIDTTGHNIANVNTEGYSRQRVDFATRLPQPAGDGFIGSGVRVDTIARSYDRFLVADARERLSGSAGFDTLKTLSARLDNLLADPESGLSAALQDFFGALQGVAANPASLPERQVLLSEAQVLADTFQSLDQRFARLNAEVNALAQGIADINERIVRSRATSGGEAANDLLDSRDRLLDRLAQQVGITTVEQSDGAVNVLAGSGQALVVGSRAGRLQTFTDPLDSTRTSVGLAGAGAQVDIGGFLKGGELGAALAFRGRTLDSARGTLGLVATGLTATFNAQHRLGMDLQGQPGADFFTPLQPAVTAHGGNTGSATASAVISDATALTGAGYRLSFDGAQWLVVNESTGASQSGSGPFSVDGLQIEITGTANAGDVFRVQPGAQAAGLFSLALGAPESIAAAVPVRSAVSADNLGTGALSALAVESAAGLPLAGPVTLTFNENALGAGSPGFDVAGAAGGPVAYDPGTQAAGLDVTLAGMRFTVSGQPQDGDSFILENNTGGSGDNRNALALAGLREATPLRGGTTGYGDAYATLVADVAVRSRQAAAGAETEAALLEQATAALLIEIARADHDDDPRETRAVEGALRRSFELDDEEIANLIRYQQAYQAAAQVISVADTLFQTLLSATGRR